MFLLAFKVYKIAVRTLSDNKNKQFGFFTDNLGWLKPVSTLEGNILIRRLNSNVMVTHQTPIIAEQDAFIFVTMAKALHTLVLAAHISKTNASVPSFLFLKFNQHAKIKLSAKFKNYMWSGFRATLNN